MEVNLEPIGATLLPDLIARVLEAMDVNDQALNGRLVSKDASRRLSKHVTFALPLPPTVGDAAWQPHLQRAFRHLTYRARLQMLSGAAASGSELNLEVAWGLLQPFLFPGLRYEYPVGKDDPGSAAVRSGHQHLLPWLLQHGCPVSPTCTLAVAAELCDLAGLQQAWGLLVDQLGPRYDVNAHGQVARAARRPGGGVAIAKLSWLMEVMAEGLMDGRKQQQFLTGAAAGAAAVGDLSVLQWLVGLGLDLQYDWIVWSQMPNALAWWDVLAAALEHGHVAVADWLVDVAGCPLPQQQDGQGLNELWKAAGRGGSMEAVRWLLRQGQQACETGLEAAAGAGWLEGVQFLHRECGLQLTERVFVAAVRRGSVPTATWLLQAGCPTAGPHAHAGAYHAAAAAGSAAMVLRLAREAKCPLGSNTLSAVISPWPVGARCTADLEPTVRALVQQEGCPPGVSAGTAASRGHVDLARWLHQELGAGFSDEVLSGAAVNGSQAGLEWLVERGCVVEDEWYPLLYLTAAMAGDLATLSCLRRLGVPWDPDKMLLAASGSIPLPVLRWIVEQGVPCSEAVVRAAVALAIDKDHPGWPEALAWFEGRLARGWSTDGDAEAGQVAEAAR